MLKKTFDLHKKAMKDLDLSIVTGEDIVASNESGIYEETINNIDKSLKTIAAKEDYSDAVVSVENDTIKTIASTIFGREQYLSGPDSDMEIYDNDMGIDVSNEAFDNIDTKTSLTLTLSLNMEQKQDEFSEEFFPTYMIDPAKGRALVYDFNVMSFVDDFVRSKSGKATDINKNNVIKSLYDGSILNRDKTAIIPAWNPETASNFVDNTKYKTTNDFNEDVDTGAFKIGQKVDILSNGFASKAILDKGVMDNTDILDTNIKLKNVVISIKGKDENGVVITEKVRIPTSLLTSASFTKTPAGSANDMQLDFNEIVSLDLANTLATSGGASKIITNLNTNLNAEVYLKLNGSSNAETGAIEVYGNRIEFRDISNENMVLPEDDAVVKKIKNIELAIVGWEVSASRTNTNLRSNGIRVTSETKKRPIYIPFRSGFSLSGPKSGLSNDNDYVLLSSSIKLVQHVISAVSVVKIKETAAQLKAKPKSFGIGSEYFNPTYVEDTIDLPDYVSNIKSQDKEDDVHAALKDKIKHLATELAINSNYATAYGVEYPSNNVFQVTIGVSNDISKLFKEKEFRLTHDMSAKVVKTANKEIDAIYIGFKDLNQKSKPSIFNFGTLGMAPTAAITTETKVKELDIIPSYVHVVNTPILGKLNVNGIKEVYGKLPVLSK